MRAAREELRTGARTAALTRRRREVAFLVARGLTDRHIAGALSLSEHTVATYIRKILEKLTLRSRARISARVAEQRLLPQEPD